MSSSPLCQKSFPHLFENIMKTVTGSLREACDGDDALLGLICGAIHCVESGSWAHSSTGRKSTLNLASVIFIHGFKPGNGDFLKSFISEPELRWASGETGDEAKARVEQWKKLAKK